MIFLFPWWDMLISWRVSIICLHVSQLQVASDDFQLPFGSACSRSKSSSKVKRIYDPEPHAMVIAPCTVLRCMATMRWWRPCCWRRQMWKNAMMKVGDLVGWNDERSDFSPGFLNTVFFGEWMSIFVFSCLEKGMCKGKKQIIKQMGGVS